MNTLSSIFGRPITFGKGSRLVAIVLLLCCFSMEKVMSQVNFVSTPASVTVNPVVDNTFTVNIAVASASNQTVDVVEIHLNFDPAVLRVQSVTPDSSLPLTIPLVPLSFDNGSGEIDYSAGTFTAPFPIANFDYIEIVFEAIGTGSTSIDYSFDFPRATIITGGGNNVLGSSNSITVEIAAPDVTAPVITLLGANPLELTVGDAYTELNATASDDVDGDISGNIIIDASAVNTALAGTYQVSYNVSDAAGNAATEVIRAVNVTAAPDVTAPVITLLGANPLELTVGDAYTELNATASDDVDGDISGNIIIDASAVNTALAGTYQVSYNVSDAAGNAATEVIRAVNVTAAPDVTAPVITLLGANPLELTVGDAYTELNATASDDVDGDISGNIIIDASAVNTALAGTYQVSYNVSDAAGNAATEVIRAVNVTAAPDVTAPVITLLGANPLELTVGDAYTELNATASDDVDGDISGNIIIDASAVNTALAGTYQVTYNVSDATGNDAAQVTRTVNVTAAPDTTAPVITLLGANPLELTVGDAYIELNATASDDVDGDISGNIIIDASAVNTALAGTYQVTYNVSDATGNDAAQVTRTVNVTAAPDTTAPVITLLGANPLELTVGDAYTELNATASDDVDGDISGNIIIDASAVNTALAGTYQVTYNVSDATGNDAAQVTRTVNVTAAPDTTAPVITLLGANPLELTVGDAYTELNATASDDVDGDISGNIIIDASAVNTALAGTYQVTYNVSDAAGNDAAQVTRTVNVTAAPDVTAPVITLLGDNPLELTVGDTYIEPGATATDDVDVNISGNIVIDATSVDVNSIGSYNVTYNVSDAADNVADEVIRAVNVNAAPDVTAPVITLLGANPLELTVGDAYTELNATASDDVDGDISGNIIIDASAVNTALAGTYQVSYNVSDAAGNAATEVIRAVNVNAAPDVFLTVSPAITNATETDIFTVEIQVQANTQPVDLAEVYLAFDATVVNVVSLTVGTTLPVPLVDPAFDNSTGTIQYGAGIFNNFPSGTFNLLTIEFQAVGAGTTNLTFIDPAGPASTIVTSGGSNVLTGSTNGQITIAAAPDTTAPIITLNGDQTVNLEVGDLYTEQGASALDTVDGPFAATVGGDTVDTSIAGTYTVRYTATDAAGNVANEVTRTVNVIEGGVFLSVDPITTNVGNGDSFEVKVLLETGLQAVTGAEIHLSFDPTILQITDVTELANPFGLSIIAPTFDNNLGTIDYAAGTFTQPFPSGSFELITISFNAISSGTSSISFVDPPGPPNTTVTSNVDVLDGTNDGTVIVALDPELIITPNSLSANLFIDETTTVSYTLDSNNETVLPSLATTVIIDNATSTTASWATTDPGATQGVPNQLIFNSAGLTPGIYNATLTASGVNGYADVLIPVSLVVSALPNLVFTPDTFEFVLDTDQQDAVAFGLNTSNASPLPQDITVVAIDDATAVAPSWLSLNPTNDGFIIDTAGLASGDYTATITASGTNVVETSATVNLTVLESTACARVAFDTGGNLAGSSTFGGGLFITNNSTGSITITSVSIDLSTAVFPNMVFDPIGTAGDATAKCVTIISQTGGDSNVGLTIPGDNGTGSDVDCTEPFSSPNGPGGYNVMALNFNDFEVGETVNIAVDVDPRSIEGFNSAGNAGAISGSELIGSTVTVTYSDGTSATRQLYQVGNSVVNSENFFSPATEQCAAPSLSLGGSTGNVLVNETNQITTISGPANANIELLVYGTTLEDLGTNIPTNQFEMNKTQSLQQFSGVLDGSGQLNIPLNLTGVSDQQVYYIVSTIIPTADDCGPGACDISNILRIKVDNELPVITLIGEEVVDLAVGDEYTELGATANDVVDGELSSSIVIGGDIVDTDNVGTYVVTYNVNDAAGNVADQVVRTVNVTDGDLPIITLIGEEVVDLAVGDEYTEQGATATDNVDGNLTASIVIGGDIVDTDNVGTYVVTYDVSDAAGNASDQVVRTVNVTDTPITVNPADADINIALLPDAVLSGTVTNGRGTPQAILYDPVTDDYVVPTNWNEYGVAFNANLGRPIADDGFKWQVDWSSPKLINYITFGGTYPNQPQPNTQWRISYLRNGIWTVIEEGRGGWIDSGIYEWGGASQVPFEADALRVQLYSDGANDLVSIHLRGRGGVSLSIDDSATATKATLIQYLPSAGPDTTPPTIVLNGDEILNLAVGDEYTEQGATATDNVDGNLTASIVIGGDIVDTDNVGTYVVTYDVSDAAGNASDQVVRTVNVTDTPITGNPADADINIALLPDAVLSGTVTNGRGTPQAILYDPVTDDYVVPTNWNEYGVAFNANLGRPIADDGFKWQVDWSSPKLINYITFGGTYPNQPQPNTQWRISYLRNGIWTVIEEGRGGWIDSGIYEWGGASQVPFEADALRVQLYSDGANDLVSIHLRGRGGVSLSIDDSATATKATLIQYLPSAGPDTTPPTIVLNGDEILNLAVGDEYTEQGATATDNVDGNLTASIVIGGDIVDTDNVGTYVVTYDVSDAAGNASDQVVRTVNVTDTPITGNPADADINIALLPDAVLSGTVTNGRGTPQAILYDPVTDDYVVPTNWNEYGVAFNANLGRPIADDGFKWQVDWSSPKLINYITFGGTYPNQPQPNTQWRISYLRNGIWTVIEEGRGGWIDSGIYEWGGASQVPFEADALRVQLYSDGANDLVSIHLRGRGGVSLSIDDSATATKATLIQYLPSAGPDTTPPTIVLNGDEILNLAVGDEYTEQGATATDNVDGNLTASIVIGGDIVDTDNVGTYVVTYDVSDAAGNASDQVVRTVNVTDTPITGNPADADINIALLPDAVLSGTVTNGRGTPQAILYDPVTDDYVVPTNWNEYGVAFNANLGRPIADDGFKWQVDWSSPKLINYITFGGTYPNQPQPNTQWRISYLSNGIWTVIEEGRGGWIDSGIYEWGGASQVPFEADALRVQLYSDGANDLVSIHLRGRGGVSLSIDDSATATKATLIQYLPPSNLSARTIPLNNMILYPNPATIETNLSFDQPTTVGTIQVFDVTGRLVRTINGGLIDKRGTPINVQEIPTGVYFIKTIDTSGLEFQQQMVIRRQ